MSTNKIDIPRGINYYMYATFYNYVPKTDVSPIPSAKLSCVTYYFFSTKAAWNN